MYSELLQNETDVSLHEGTKLLEEAQDYISVIKLVNTSQENLLLQCLKQAEDDVAVTK